jgi:hypothetical protein
MPKYRATVRQTTTDYFEGEADSAVEAFENIRGFAVPVDGKVNYYEATLEMPIDGEWVEVEEDEEEDDA